MQWGSINLRESVHYFNISLSNKKSNTKVRSCICYIVLIVLHSFIQIHTVCIWKCVQKHESPLFLLQSMGSYCFYFASLTVRQKFFDSMVWVKNNVLSTLLNCGSNFVGKNDFILLYDQPFQRLYTHSWMYKSLLHQRCFNVLNNKKLKLLVQSFPNSMTALKQQETFTRQLVKSKILHITQQHIALA